MVVQKGLKDEAQERREYRDKANEPMDRPHAFRKREDEMQYQKGRDSANETREYLAQKEKLNQEAREQREFRNKTQSDKQDGQGESESAHGWKAEKGPPSTNGWGAGDEAGQPESESDMEAGA